MSSSATGIPGQGHHPPAGRTGSGGTGEQPGGPLAAGGLQFSSRPRRGLADALFKAVTGAFASLILVLVLLLVLELVRSSWPSLKAFGWRFLVTQTWDPVRQQFGALPFIFGTVVSSLLALILSVPVSLGIAIYLAEMAPHWLRGPVSFLVELLAAIPSVIYGLWGIFVLVPLVRQLEVFLGTYLGFIPLFSGPPYGIGMLAAGIILAIMITPTIAAVSRDVILAVPNSQREASLALGATRWETIRNVVLEYAQSGIIGAIILGLGRALGETMAVTMVIGNRPEISASLFSFATSLTSVIANEFNESGGALHISALVELGLVLFLVTIVLNSLARFLVWQVQQRNGGAARV
ncbi:MAG: phosphate ABC transporter permease subunit PstC [Firmicutes bacterium]|nr:phosphate ABC transporter permease subunit PstC [Bacillota bacterium]